ICFRESLIVFLACPSINDMNGRFVGSASSPCTGTNLIPLFTGIRSSPRLPVGCMEPSNDTRGMIISLADLSSERAKPGFACLLRLRLVQQHTPRDVRWTRSSAGTRIDPYLPHLGI